MGYECYNEAYYYLRDKYGYQRKGLTCSASNRLLKVRTVKERKEIEASFTDRDYNLVLNVNVDTFDASIPDVYMCKERIAFPSGLFKCVKTLGN